MQNNECIYVSEQFTEYQDNSLSSEIRARVDTHLAVCSLCRNTYQELNDLLNRLHDLPAVGAKADFTENLLSRIEALNQESTWQKIYRSSYTRVAGYAVAAGFVFALGLNIWIDPISSVSPIGSQRIAGEGQVQKTSTDSPLASQVDSVEYSKSDSITFQRNTINSGTQSLQLVSDR